MGRIDGLYSRVQDVSQKLEKVLSLEKEISDEERQESAEIQKLREMSERLQNAGSDSFEGEAGILEEEVQDFVEAVNLFSRISAELEETANDLHSIIEEMEANASDELEIVEGLAQNQVQIKDLEKIEELAESLNTTHVNTEKVVEESKKAKEEAKEARGEIEKLLELDQFIEKIDPGRHDLSSPEQELQEARNQLKDAEWKLGEIPDRITQARQTSQQTAETIEENISTGRRNVIKGAGAIGVAALTGLSGCSAIFDMKNYDEENNLYTGRVQYIGEIEITKGYWGVMGETEPVPVYDTVDLDTPPTNIQAIYIFDIENRLAELGLEKCEVSEKALEIKITDPEVDRYGNHPEFVENPCLELNAAALPVYFGMSKLVDTRPGNSNH